MVRPQGLTFRYRFTADGGSTLVGLSLAALAESNPKRVLIPALLEHGCVL